MEIHYTHLTNHADVQAAAAVMQQLRSQFSVDVLAQKTQTQMTFGYHLLAAKQHAEIVGFVGYVISQKLAWKHLYIDDLVTHSGARGRGVGEGLLRACIDIARQQQCESLHLDSGVQRFDAHRFYLRHRLSITSHHFAIGLEQ